MMVRRLALILGFCVALGAAWFCTGQAQDDVKHVGSEVCLMCHSDTSKTWALTAHRGILFSKDPSANGCEACHGPGGAHVEGGGDIKKIIRPQELPPDKLADMCLKCHTGEHVTLWHTSVHARAKMSCIKCHDVHKPGQQQLLSDLENARLSVEGLTRAIKQTDLASNIPAEGSQEKLASVQKVRDLQAGLEKARKELKGAETAYRRNAEPYVCYDCHKAQEVRTRMPSHHPIHEGKFNCSDCHNAHGGPNGMLAKETVNETCRTCHAEKAGPYVFEHPAVTEDCLNCHDPHGSVQNKLLTQNEPFLCMKCHSGTHAARGDVSRFTQRYTTCTNCHTQVHGSDSNEALFD
ncbi:MAG: hypothetical protein KBC96_14300 [Armatimonadetes bacterium]|nr:hypothetical protein [Armatimonadota bacterium]